MPRASMKTNTRPAAAFRPAVLLTGFGPFPGVADNVSGRLVEALRQRAARKFPHYRFACEVLDTEWRQAPARIGALIEDLQPVLSLHFGVAQGSRTLRIETQASNLCRSAVDAAGLPPLSPLLVRDGAAFHQASIPVSDIYQKLEQRGVPVSISDDAGGYLCNAVLYQSLSHSRAQGRPAMSGFIHLPDDLSRPPLTFSVALNACLIVIGTCLANG